MSLTAAAGSAVIAPPSFHAVFEAHAAGWVVAPSLQGFGEVLGTADSAVILAKFSALSTAYRTNPALLAPAILKLNPTERDEIMSLTAWVPEKKLRLLQRLHDARLEAAPAVAELVSAWLPTQISNSAETTEHGLALRFYQLERYETYLRDLAALYPHADIDAAIDQMSARKEEFRTAYLNQWTEESQKLGMNDGSVVASKQPIHPSVYKAIGAGENTGVVSAQISMDGAVTGPAQLEILRRIQESMSEAPSLRTNSRQGTLSVGASSLFLRALIHHPAVAGATLVQAPPVNRFFVTLGTEIFGDMSWNDLIKTLAASNIRIVSSTYRQDIVVEGDWAALKRIGKPYDDFLIYPLSGQ